MAGHENENLQGPWPTGPTYKIRTKGPGGEIVDVTLDHAAALQRGFFGLWWASIVGRKGPAAAAAYPLVEDDEAEAQYIAKSAGNPSRAQFKAIERTIAATTNDALNAFADCMPLLNQVADMTSIPDDLDRKVDNAVGRLEWFCRRAAKTARVLYLVRRRQEAGQ